MPDPPGVTQHQTLKLHPGSPADSCSEPPIQTPGSANASNVNDVLTVNRTDQTVIEAPLPNKKGRLVLSSCQQHFIGPTQPDRTSQPQEHQGGGSNEAQCSDAPGSHGLSAVTAVTDCAANEEQHTIGTIALHVASTQVKAVAPWVCCKRISILGLQACQYDIPHCKAYLMSQLARRATV